MIVKYNSNTFGKWYQQNSRASRGWPRSKTSIYITLFGIINLNHIFASHIIVIK